MAGTKQGGLHAAASNKAKFGEDFYKIIGAKGGAASYIGKKGFAGNRELARRAGALGGAVSRRGAWTAVEHETRAKRKELRAKPAGRWWDIKTRRKIV